MIGEFEDAQLLAIGSNSYQSGFLYGVTHDGSILLSDGTEYAPAGSASVPVCAL